MPDQFEGPGEKRGCPGDMKVLGNNAPTIGLLQEEKSARGRWVVSCSGTLFLLDDDVVDKLFGF